VSDELGDLLFSLVNVARLSNIDAEDACQRTIEKFRRRFSAMEADLIARGTSVSAEPPAQLEHAWERAKARERGGSEAEP